MTRLPGAAGGAPAASEEPHERPRDPAWAGLGVPSPWTAWRRGTPSRRAALAFVGPAFLVSIGYMDPGNWGTDLAAGSRFGYRLLWVPIAANATAVVLQYLAAKLGIATGRDLAALVGERLRPGQVVGSPWRSEAEPRGVRGAERSAAPDQQRNPSNPGLSLEPSRQAARQEARGAGAGPPLPPSRCAGLAGVPGRD